jgi:lantibiotic modifying enzyme
MLFEPQRHEALDDTAWDAELARTALRAIAQEIEQQRLPDGRWPLHPDDDEGDEPRTGIKTLYQGRAGVLWALWALQRAGAIDLHIDLPQALLEAEQAYRADPDFGPARPSLFSGESGLLWVLWQLTGADTAADRLHAAVRANLHHPSQEAYLGSPGTLLLAWQMWRATGQARWRDAFVEGAEVLWQGWVFDEGAQCHLWTQQLYGKTVQYLGAGHGFAGCVQPLLLGADLLDAAHREQLYERTEATLAALARTEGDAVNWPPGTFKPRPDGPQVLMQWCHGAPGIVTALAGFPRERSARMEALLTGAGQAIWQAGPLAKGPGLCHGTAGNGLAFLTLYRRTGNDLWLQRARAFAMHALAQSERLRLEHGQARCTLGTGDAGLALYLWRCLEGGAALPGL